MRCEEGARSIDVSEMLEGGVGDSEAVDGRSSAAEFVEQHLEAGRSALAPAPATMKRTHQRVRCSHLENTRRLVHLDHEGRPITVQLVSSADSAEDAVEDTDARALGGDVRAALGKNGDEGGLSQEGTLPSHVLRDEPD